MISDPRERGWDRAQARVLSLPADASGVVVGAPGTGKTAVLVERVARLLADGVAADELVVLTPTRVSATRLRDELGLRVQVATPGPLARSVGSFAFQVVRADAVRRGDEAPKLLTGADQDRIVADILAGDEQDEADGLRLWPEHLGAPVRASKGFRSELRAFLAELAELGVGPAELAALDVPAWTSVSRFMRDYRNVLDGMRSPHREVAELYAEAAAALRAGAAIAGLERLRVVLIDDAQELTRGGIAVVEALRARDVAVLAFGDPDIGSGAFRGVTPELFAQLSRALGTSHVLDGEHRSTARLTRLVRTVTQSIGAAGVVAHRRSPGEELEEDGTIETLLAASPYEEIDRIAWTLRDWHLLGGVPWSRIAVIAHDTRQLTTLEAELAAREVPTRAAGVQRPLGSEPAVHDIVEIVRLGLADHADRDAESLLEALRSPFGGLDGVGLRRLRAHLRHAELAEGGNRPARELLHEALGQPASFDLLDTPESRTAKRLAETLRLLHEEGARGATIHELLWLVWDRAKASDGQRLERAWHQQAQGDGPVAAEVARALDGLVALFAAAKRSVERSPEEGPHPFIREILDSDVPEDTLSAPDRDGAVTLMTPANALGVEFDAVVIAGVQEGVWPNVRLRGGLLESWRLADVVAARRERRGEPEPQGVLDRRRAAMHDELRLFVRAVSRARTRLLVTAVDDDATGPSALFSFLPPPRRDDDQRTEHPLTLRGLVARHRRVLTSSDDTHERAEAAGQLAMLAQADVAGAAPEDWYGVREPSTDAPLRDLDAGPARVSPSRMEAFEECGLGWVIDSLGGDTVTAPSAGIGTILHAALERYPDGDLDGLRSVVEERWSELDFETPWIAVKERKRAETYVDRLHSYLREVRRDGGAHVVSEASFRFAVETAAEHDAPPRVYVGEEIDGPRRAIVSGVIDRVETYPPGGGEHALARSRGWSAMAPAAPADEHVVVVDLKSGRYEKPGDNDVLAHGQLAAYQIAVQEGLVDGAASSALAGARLVIVSQTLAKSDYRVAHQHRLAEEPRAEFLRRVAEAARGMSASSFTAQVDAHCTEGMFVKPCRIHTIPSVSA
ncbi:ATP-dependent DNA helicase [Microbacterium stercoris]|uniref:DNA 3'-5' helicase n=1 Tax=Microbacterium stercoris TaxID=2820289 RepID=A0A939QG52_9MICO|nr:ATP-dependent DNA helicase [Microbacterium stercoris]MBO3662329.1 ATP-dependent helicase [Microbacterium stercoris]MBO3664321.1 ATP-dependent helicase [Microbacterium stercoris]